MMLLFWKGTMQQNHRQEKRIVIQGAASNASGILHDIEALCIATHPSSALRIQFTVSVTPETESSEHRVQCLACQTIERVSHNC